MNTRFFLTTILFLTLALPLRVDAGDDKSFLPLEIGTRWIFEGDGEAEMIYIRDATVIGQTNALRVLWVVNNPKLKINNVVKQVEYWKSERDGVVILGRRGNGFEVIFQDPYYFIRYEKGAKWQGAVDVGDNRKIILNYMNQGMQEVKTPLGNFNALKIRLNIADKTIFDRYYAPGLGIVQYTTYIKSPEGAVIRDDHKVLVAYKKPK